eukprot:3934651-Rhodomonas_salina.1
MIMILRSGVCCRGQEHFQGQVMLLESHLVLFPSDEDDHNGDGGDEDDGGDGDGDGDDRARDRDRDHAGGVDGTFLQSRSP